jgi:hypothetical protein
VPKKSEPRSLALSLPAAAPTIDPANETDIARIRIPKKELFWFLPTATRPLSIAWLSPVAARRLPFRFFVMAGLDPAIHGNNELRGQKVDKVT